MLPQFPRALPALSVQGVIRSTPEDFQVEEVLALPFSDQGEHLYLWVQKSGANTRWVAAQLARHYGVAVTDVAYAGLKDRHALTWQWFSLRLPGTTLPAPPVHPEFQVLAQRRHKYKLRTGEHLGNRFRLRIRDLRGDLAGLTERVSGWGEACRLPNYFGPQRFGRAGNNLTAASAWLLQAGAAPRRADRGILLSAARALLFNQVLAYRVLQQNWCTPVPGELLLDGLPSGPLWGRGRSGLYGQAAALEQAALRAFQPWCQALEQQGLHQDRRSLVLIPEGFSAAFEDRDLCLSFTLASGQFATSVLAELGDWLDVFQATASGSG